MDKQESNRSHPIARKILTVVVVLLVLAAARLLLGSKEMMYLSATDVDHIEATVLPDNISVTAVGDDSAAAVKILNRTVCHYPQAEKEAGQSVTLTLYMHDGTTMTVTACGSHFEIDGKGYKARSSDGEALVEWAKALSEKTEAQS